MGPPEDDYKYEYPQRLADFNWHLSKINQGYQMTRISVDSKIECRNLYWWEKIIYFWKIKKEKVKEIA